MDVLLSRDYDGQLSEQRKVIVRPEQSGPHRRLGLAYLQKKMNAEALERYKSRRLFPAGTRKRLLPRICIWDHR